MKRMKENDGKAALQRKIGLALRMLSVLALFVGVILYNITTPPSTNNEGTNGKKSLNLLGDNFQGKHPQGHSPNQKHHGPKRIGDIESSFLSNKITGNTQEDQIQQILQAKVALIGIVISPKALAPSSSAGATATDYGKGITAMFCPIDWSLQKKNPSTVPMFKDLISQSKDCSSNQIKVDLKDIMQRVKGYDNGSGPKKSNLSDPDNVEEDVKVKVMEPKGFVFHETRCGSTLVANSLAGFDPLANRVYSESPPPVTALKACTGKSTKDCDNEKAAQVFRDVVYLMGRTNDTHERNLFFKIQSVGVQSISTFTKAFPTKPWMFVYRDSVEVMMSHYKNGLRNGAVCTRARHHPPPILQQVVNDRNDGGRTTTSLSKLSNAEFCAAHLASLCESAIHEYVAIAKANAGGDHHYGTFINYNQLPNVLWESILPNHFGMKGELALTQQNIENIQKVSGVYSKGRAKKANQEWTEDSTKKQQNAPSNVQEAADKYMKPCFDQMEQYNKYK